MSWNPDLYLRFEDHRMRPAVDLIHRIPPISPARITDLGCGTGAITRLVAERWPEASVTAVDNAPAMLSPDRTSAIRWVAADIADWRPAEPQQLIFSNAALNWLDDHPVLIPELIECLAPGGVLALQMPRNYGAPSHRAIVEVANSGPWAGRLEPLLRPHPVARPQDYFDLLAPLVQTTDIWETEYLHVLDGEDAVATWVEGTTLGPLVAALDGNDREAFRAAFRDRLKADYPPRPDGTTLFPFRRLFVVAVR